MKHQLPARWLAGFSLVVLALAVGTGGEAQIVRAAVKAQKSLRVKATARAGTTTPRTIAAGVPVSGTFTPDDPSLTDGSHYQLWRYSGRAGERLTVLMTSGEFESYLYFSSAVSGALVEIARDDGSAGRDAHLEVELPADGEYLIAANAYRAGVVGRYTLSVTSSTARVVARNWRQIYPGGGDPNERYALLVGIGDYPGPDDDLGDARPNVAIMRDILVGKLGFRPDNVITLTDTDATREAISNAFLRHLTQAGPDGVAVFYFTGHGVRTPSNWGIPAPLDPEPEDRDQAFVILESPSETGILLDDELGFLISRLRTRRTLIVLDACYSGSGTRAPGAARQKGLTFRKLRPRLKVPAKFLVDRSGAPTAVALRAGASARSRTKAGGTGSGAVADGMRDLLGDPEDHVLLTASADDELSWASTGLPNREGFAGVFTAFLADAIAEDDGTATIEVLMNRVRAQAVPFSQRLAEKAGVGGPQTPQARGAHKTTTLRSFLARR